MTHNFRKLKIWQEGMVIVSATYKMTRIFTDFENRIQQLQKMISRFQGGLDK